MAPKILLAEDEAGICELVCSLLGEQYEVVRAENGAAVFELFKKKERPDVVLLNYLLPDAAGRPPEKIGLTLLRFIKQESPKTIVIMFTGSDELDVAFQAGRLGAFAYVLKSYESGLEKLKDVLKSAFEYKKTNKKISNRPLAYWKTNF
jgi:DNA-binding NtrC family response regulator